MRGAARARAGSIQPCWRRLCGRPRPCSRTCFTPASPMPTIPPPFWTALPWGRARPIHYWCCSCSPRLWLLALCRHAPSNFASLLWCEKICSRRRATGHGFQVLLRYIVKYTYDLEGDQPPMPPTENDYRKPRKYRKPNELASRPPNLGRQGHQDRLDIAAGHQAELGAAVVQQVELDVAAAPHQLVFALGFRPRLVHVPAHQLGIDREEGLADVAGEGEVAGEVAAVEIVVKDAADAARLAAVGQMKVLVAPLLEARIVGGVLAIAGGLEGGMEGVGVGLMRHHRRQV